MLSNNSVEITLNGTAEKTLYMRLKAGNLSFALSSDQLYKEEYATNP